MTKLQILWILILAVSVVVELITSQLVSIWFAVGALVCSILAIFNIGNIQIQLIAFLLTSVLTLLILRPYCKKRLNTNIVKTNCDEVINQDAIVIEDFINNEGRVKVNNMDWKAKANENYQVGETVKVLKIEGVTLIVERR